MHILPWWRPASYGNQRNCKGYRILFLFTGFLGAILAHYPFAAILATAFSGALKKM